MLINVSQLLQEPAGSTRDYEIDEDVETISEKSQSHVAGRCHLLRTQRSILVRCHAETEVVLTCSRCLSQFHRLLTIDFEEEYMPTIDIRTGLPLPPPEDASAFTIDHNHVIDLAEAIRQYSVMALPMKALCHEDCAGLCPRCGQNLNEGRCNCQLEDIDARWAKLLEFLR
ncbi:MAG: DUF177 domain-containing protein [Dehalococcoidales bacterium]|nr:DUF177 domain-containing protein [Dehalococcoidales bacterium]